MSKTKKRSAWRRLLGSLGPGVVTGAADDDPSGIATYSITGAKLGTSLLWTSVFSWPLMAATQLMCARIGQVTGEGLASALRKRFPKWILMLAVGALLVANTINIGADLLGMSDAAEMLTGLDSQWFAVLFGLGITWATVGLRYARIAAILKWLALSLFAYVITAFFIGPDWSAVLRDAFIPSLPRGHGGWSALVAILGTTISPYLFFWQTSQEVEEKKAAGKKTVRERSGATRDQISMRRLDVGIGTFFSNLVMFFIILTTALTLHRNGIQNVENTRQIAEALAPLAGRFAAALFTLGLFGTGLLAIPTLAGSAAYAFAETFHWRQGLNQELSRARPFYGVVIAAMLIGIAMDFAKVNAVQALFWSAVVNGVLAPFLLVGILMIASDRKRMNGQPSSWTSRITVGIVAGVMFAAALTMFVL